MLAEALGAAGRADEGLGWVDKAIALAEKAELQFWSAELHRRRGELLLQTGGSRERAIAAFHHACDLAKAQSARSLLDRAATSLARATGIPDGAQDTGPTTAPSSATSGRQAK
jgi:predicted ATPase